MSNLEAVAAPIAFTTEQMAILKKALQWAKEEMDHMDEDLVSASAFRFQQEVMLLENSFGQTYFTGLKWILQILLHKIRMAPAQG